MAANQEQTPAQEPGTTTETISTMDIDDLRASFFSLMGGIVEAYGDDQPTIPTAEVA